MTSRRRPISRKCSTTVSSTRPYQAPTQPSSTFSRTGAPPKTKIPTPSRLLKAKEKAWKEKQQKDRDIDKDSE